MKKPKRARPPERPVEPEKALPADERALEESSGEAAVVGGGARGAVVGGMLGGAGGAAIGGVFGLIDGAVGDEKKSR